MQDSEIKKGGGKRTDADRDTAFRLGTGTGPGRVGDPVVKSQSAQGKGNAAKRRMNKEELEASGLFTAAELEALEERLNPFQVTFDKDGNEEDREKRDSTPEAKAADAKRAKNAAENRKKGPMKYDPYKSRAGESD